MSADDLAMLAARVSAAMKLTKKGRSFYSHNNLGPVR